jgi:hypothetical protein
MNRRGIACALGGVGGALAAFALARVMRPLLPVPGGGIGFVTVHAIPKGIDTLRYVLLVGLIAAGILAGARVSARGFPSPGPRPPSPTGEEATAPSHAPTRKLFLALGFLVFRFFYGSGIHGPVDLFHAGHYLSPAADVLAGKTFFRDALPFHGLFVDGGLDLAAFRMFGETLMVARGLRIVLDLAFFATVLAALAILARSAAAFSTGVAILVLLTSAFRLEAGFPFYRTIPLVLAAVLTARAVATGRRRFAGAAGAAAGAGLFWSLETGLFAAGACLLAFLLLERRRLAALLAGLGIGLLPGVLYLWQGRALAGFVGESWTVVRSMDAIWGLPAPGFRDLTRFETLHFRGDTPHYYVPIFLFGSIAGWLLLRRRGGAFGDRERVAAVLLVFSAVAFRTALGRYSYSHTRYSMVIPSLLIAFLWSSRPRRVRHPMERVEIALFVAALAIYGEALPAASNLAAQVRGLGPRWSGAGLSPVSLRRFGRARIPPGQAAGLQELAAFSSSRLAPGETFYDFSDSAALYFFLERSNPTLVYEASCLSADAFEQRAISDLERRRPGFVVISAPGRDAFDGVPIAVRAPRVDAWVRANYPREMNVGGFRVRVP